MRTAVLIAAVSVAWLGGCVLAAAALNRLFRGIHHDLDSQLVQMGAQPVPESLILTLDEGMTRTLLEIHALPECEEVEP